MCGIIGYVGARQALPILLEGLSRLEYRGYDSAGVAVIDGEGDLAVHKTPGKLRNLIASVESALPSGFTGLGHTRWATHGVPNEVNAHPHTDCREQVVIVHNGIVENYAELRASLHQQGHVFTSQTDSEVIAHLIEEELQRDHDFSSAFRRAVGRLQGAQAIAALWRSQPRTLVGVRLGNAGGISVGYGQEEMFLASDLPALLPLADKVVFLAPGEMVTLSPQGAVFTGVDGRPLVKQPTVIPYNPLAAARGLYNHFMEKEIHEQPESVTNAIRGRVSFTPENIFLEEVPFTSQEIRELKRIILVAMGTSLHAALVGQLMIEQLSGIPTTAENASEFRYRDPVLDRQTLVLAIGQSGETVDTLAAMEEARNRGARLLTICNAEDSQATRLAEGTIHMRAGLEIGVAATKTFLNTLAVLYLLGSHLGIQRDYFGGEALREAVHHLARLPDLVGVAPEPAKLYVEVAREYFQRSNFLYIGRGVHYPIALEGALKLKEISYIHAEGTAAGEMKHGPIALVDSSLPVVVLCPRNHLYDKMMANLSEISARDGTVIAIATQGDQDVREKAAHVLYVPEAPYLLSSILTAVPLQLLAYHIAVLRGCDVDQPRNLAKSVTVE